MAFCERPNHDLTQRRKKRERDRNIRRWAGVVVLAIGIGLIGYVPYFYLHSRIVGSDLINRAILETQRIHQDNLSVPVDVNFETGNLIGKITIPSLHLNVPLLQGTADKELAIGAGHLSSSVLPGRSGTSVLAAHNVTWFHRINQLKVGDTIKVTTAYGAFNYIVTGSRVAPVGSTILNSEGPSIALEACYPLNALYLTPNRYFVFARQVNRAKGRDTYPASNSGSTMEEYSVEVPSLLKSEGLTLATNMLPMGLLSYSGYPSQAYKQSDGPLNASSALVELYLSWLHANADGNLTWVEEVGGQNTPTTFDGISLNRYHYDSPFDVNLNVNGDNLISLQASVNVTIIHSFHVTISAVNNGGIIRIESITVREY